MNRIKAFALLSLTLVLGIEAHALRLNILDRDGFSASQSQKLDRVITILDQVLNSPEFKVRMLAFTYNGKKAFYQNNGLSNLQVYEAIMAGAEQYPKVSQANQLADMYLSIYYPPWWKRNSSANAFTSSEDPYLNIYNSYYNSASLVDLSETVFHEWTHKLGFDHDFQVTAARPYSVPYGAGSIVNDLVKAYLKQ